MPAVRQPPITIRLDDERQIVVVDPQDNDRFVVSAAEAAKALRILDTIDVLKFREEFKRLLELLREWVLEHEQNISRAFVTRRDQNLLFLVCTKSSSLDEEFEDKLTALDLQIAEADDLSSIRMSVLALPLPTDESRDAFADPSLCLEFNHAEPPSA